MNIEYFTLCRGTDRLSLYTLHYIWINSVNRDSSFCVIFSLSFIRGFERFNKQMRTNVEIKIHPHWYKKEFFSQALVYHYVLLYNRLDMVSENYKKSHCACILCIFCRYYNLQVKCPLSRQSGAYYIINIPGPFISAKTRCGIHNWDDCGLLSSICKGIIYTFNTCNIRVYT